MKVKTTPASIDGAAEMARVVKGARGVLSQAVLRHLRASGYPSLRLPHQQVFESIDREGTRLTVLATRAGMTHQAMGELVAELVDLGYLERVADPEDRRSRLVRPTTDGLGSIDRGIEYLVAVRAAWDESLGDEINVRQVLDALGVLRRVCEVELPHDDGTVVPTADPDRRRRIRPTTSPPTGRGPPAPTRGP